MVRALRTMFLKMTPRQLTGPGAPRMTSSCEGGQHSHMTSHSNYVNSELHVMGITLSELLF